MEIEFSIYAPKKDNFSFKLIYNLCKERRMLKSVVKNCGVKCKDL